MGECKDGEGRKKNKKKWTRTPRSFSSSLLCLISLTERVVVKQLLDQVDVRHEHAAAAVPGEAERVEGVPGEREERRGWGGVER